MHKVERDIRRWLGDEKTFKGHGENGLVRSILSSYQMIQADEIEQLETLQILAHTCGYNNVFEMLGASICGADGSRTLTLTPEKAVRAK